MPYPTQYLEMSSEWRDRTLYPKPGDFVVQNQKQSVYSDTTAAKLTSDVICHGHVHNVKKWSSNDFLTYTDAAPPIANQWNSGAALTFSGVVSADAIGFSTGQTIVYIGADQTDTKTGQEPALLQFTENYYNGAITSFTGGATQQGRITGYSYVGGGVGKFTIVNLSSPPSVNDVMTIKDPTDIPNNTIYVPGGVPSNMAYTDDFVIFNETLNDFRQIVRYDGVTRLIQVDTSGTGKNKGPISVWNETSTYSIRARGIPSFNAINGNLTITTNTGASTNFVANSYTVTVGTNSTYSGTTGTGMTFTLTTKAATPDSIVSAIVLEEGTGYYPGETVTMTQANLQAITGVAVTVTTTVVLTLGNGCKLERSATATAPANFTSFNLGLNGRSVLAGDYLELTPDAALSDQYVGTIDVGVAAPASQVVIAGPTLSTNVGYDDFFKGMTLRFDGPAATPGSIEGEDYTIEAYDAASRTLTFRPPSPYALTKGDPLSIHPVSKLKQKINGTWELDTPNGDYRGIPFGETRRVKKYVSEAGTIQAPGGTTIVLTFTNSARIVAAADYYRAIWLTISSGVARGETRLIQSSTSQAGTVTVTVLSAITGLLAGDSWVIEAGIVSPRFTASLQTQQFWIQPFAIQTGTPFRAPTQTISQQSCCYEIELVSLTLPNATLIGGHGARIAFYPYVYVGLTMTTNSSGGAGATYIQSNNPNSQGMLFSVAVDDVADPLVSTFIKLNGDGMRQTINFNPNSDLRLQVKLPNGDIFDTVLNDTVPPHEANRFAQVRALFGLTRLT